MIKLRHSNRGRILQQVLKWNFCFGDRPMGLLFSNMNSVRSTAYNTVCTILYVVWTEYRYRLLVLDLSSEVPWKLSATELPPPPGAYE